MINPMSRLYSIDRQLILIMLSQCFVHVIFHLPVLIYFIYDYVTKYSIPYNKYLFLLYIIDMLLYFIL